MRYVLMFIDPEKYVADLAAMPEDDRNQVYAAVEKWFADLGDKYLHGSHLRPPETATTVRKESGESIMTDGPFIEGKEVVSGFVEIQVEDLDEALRLVESWPGCPTVELRPVYEH
ncbi:MAG: YciI family protein [Stackebrandtia sp.]